MTMDKQDIINEYGRHAGDTGSPEVQVALLTARINHGFTHKLIADPGDEQYSAAEGYPLSGGFHEIGYSLLMPASGGSYTGINI